MKSIPENDFAIVKDRERKMVIDCGTFGHMQMLAETYNRLYQSTAYVVEPWKTRS